MSNKKALYFVNEPPFPANNGVRVVSRAFLEAMVEERYDVHVFCVSDNLDFEYEINRCKEIFDGVCFSFLKLEKINPFFTLMLSLLRLEPYATTKAFSSAIHREFSGLVFKLDPALIVFDLSVSARYIYGLKTNAVTVCTINDSLALTYKNQRKFMSSGWIKKIYKNSQYVLAKRFEKRWYSKFDWIHVVSETDKKYIENFSSLKNVVSIPNGVSELLFGIEEIKLPKGVDCIYVGKLEGGNLAYLRGFIDNVWIPFEASSNSKVSLKIYGSGHGGEGLRRDYSHIKSVEIVGYVECLKDIYANGEICIVPVNKNCGIINKALEAMASGKLLMGYANSLASIKGARNGVDYIGVNTVEEFLKVLQEIDSCLDLSTKVKIARSGRETMSRKYKWRLAKDGYKKFLFRANVKQRI